MYLSHGNDSSIFFIREKDVKTWGLTGQNGGRGEFFVVPHCALQPHYGGGTTDARVSVYCSLVFFRSYTVCIFQ